MKCLRQLKKCASSRSGAAAIEFALVIPVFFILLFGIVAFGSYLAVVHSVQQLAAEAARAAVAGMSDTERNSLALAYINSNVGSYPLLVPSNLTLLNSATNASNVFQITLNYNLSSSFIYQLPSFVPGPPSTIVRSAAIQRGGY
jgi:Flp pilus assembly protein TadG